MLWHGELSERSNVPLSKSGKPQGFGGSNPPLSATKNKYGHTKESPCFFYIKYFKLVCIIKEKGQAWLL